MLANLNSRPFWRFHGSASATGATFVAATEHVDDHSRSHDVAIWLSAQQPKTRSSRSRAAANEG